MLLPPAGMAAGRAWQEAGQAGTDDKAETGLGPQTHPELDAGVLGVCRSLGGSCLSLAPAVGAGSEPLLHQVYGGGHPFCRKYDILRLEVIFVKMLVEAAGRA